jgi:hypothetical protein
VLLAAGSLFALGACGTTNKDAAETSVAQTSSATTPAAVDSVAPSSTEAAADDTTTSSSVAPDTSPLTIGVTYISNEQTTTDLGAGTPSPVNQKALVQGLVAGINADGGLNGRQLKTVEYEWDSSSNDWSLDASAACAKFTQDNDVTVVLDTAFGVTGGFRKCLNDAGVMSIQSISEGGRAAGDAASLHANSAAMTIDRAYSSVLDGLTSSGYLTADNQIGVILENCPENANAYADTLKPLMTTLGLKAPIDATVDCTTGFSSATAGAAAINNAVLKFKDGGVDRVMFVGDSEYIMLLFFTGTASSQGYTPGYLLSSGAQPQALLSSIVPDQQPQMKGVGSQPFNDVDDAELSTVDQRCVDLVTAGGVTPATYTDTSLLLFECGPFLLLESALKATNGSAVATDLADAVSGLGTTFLAPGLVESATRFSETGRDGPAMVRVFEFDPSCSCLQYSGDPQAAS